METFQTEKRNQINIVILGAVSAGKSTLLNTIFAETYSNCKIKRTTMVPQVYYEYDKKKCKELTNDINEKNKIINDELIKLTEDGMAITSEHIKEVNYIVPKVCGLTELEKKVFLGIYDIPGLNDSQTRQLYYDYVDTNFYKFDIVIFVVDINSALNTKDEVEILEKIIENCLSNYNKYGIKNKLIVLANKCDEMTDIDGIISLDGEHKEMFEQIEKITTNTINRLFPELEHSFVPISVEDSYIYRMFQNNVDFKLEPKFLNKFGFNEFGRNNWKKMNEKDKIKGIKNILDYSDMDENLMMTGWNIFKEQMNTYLSPNNQKLFINNHIIFELKKINGNTKLDISEDIQTFYKLYQRYNDLGKRIKTGIDTNSIFKTYIEDYIKLYRTNIIDGFIEKKTCDIEIFKNVIKKKSNLDSKDISVKYTECYMLKSEQNCPHVEEAKNIIDDAVRLFNGDIGIITELAKDLTDSLAYKYSNDITSQIKPIAGLFENLKLLVNNKFRITKNLISNLFSNPDMINQTPQAIIHYVETLEGDGYIKDEEKSVYILNIIKDIYMKMRTNHSSTSTYMDPRFVTYYKYFSKLFWQRFVISTDFSNPLIFEVDNLCTGNSTPNPDACHIIDDVNMFSQYNELLVLENYYKDLVTF